MIEITSGSKYIDIDAYASCIAYAKLLNATGIKARAVTTTKNFSASITESLKKLNYKIEYTDKIQDKTIILDVSNPNMISNMVLKSNIIEVIDHHPYQEFINYWNNRNVNLTLEEIGSVCTIIYEKIKEKNKIDILDGDLCKLLIAGILDNTINLKAKITKERDINALNELLIIGNIAPNFQTEYFLECQKKIEINLIETINQDLKTNINYPDIPNVFGQLLVINIDSILKKKKTIFEYMNKKYNNWIINIICLKDGKSYIIGNTQESINNLNKRLNGKISSNLLEIEPFELRKEILSIFKEKKTKKH